MFAEIFLVCVVAEILDVDVNIRFVFVCHILFGSYFLISIFGKAPNVKYSLLNYAENHKIFIFLDNILFLSF